MTRVGQCLITLIALVCLLALVSGPPAEAQILSGRMNITTDYELYGLGSLDGGGHITWTLYEEQASHLRTKVYDMFGSYSKVPPGFSCEGTVNSANFDATIDSVEAKDYTDRLENLLEDSCPDGLYAGTPDRYLTISRTDLLEKQLPVDRSTQGLVGSVASDESMLQIRFIFNAATSIGSTRFALGESSLPDALHGVFSFEMKSFVYGNSTRPLRPLEGWHNVFLGSQMAFTPSYPVVPSMTNISEAYWGFSDNSRNSSDVWPTYAVSKLRGSYGDDNWVDLRFADSAYVAVEYMGSRADPGDTLTLEVADNATFTNWVVVPDANGTRRFDNTQWLDWTTVTFPLDSYLGHLVRLRLTLVSDAVSTAAPGFFIRNFEVRGDSNYHGLVEWNSANYVVSTTSFSDFALTRGSANLIRTPAGDILLYSINYDTEQGIPPDSVQFRAFDFFENPQITFGVMVASVYLIAYYQNRYFMQFKGAHSLRYRSAASKIKWLHWLGRILIIVLILLYFFPGVVAFATSGFLIGGPAMWFLSVFITVGIALLTKFMYMRQTKFIPPETLEEGLGIPGGPGVPPPPGKEGALPQKIFCADCLNVIESPKNAYTCGCGKVYHMLCASEMGECPECHRKIKVELPKEKLLTVQCPTCHEVQHIKEGADLSRTKCSNCGTVLRALDEGLNYLVIDRDTSTSYLWFQGIVRRERPSLCLTTAFPEKVKREYSLEKADLYWLSDTSPGPKTLDPKRIEFEVIRAISNFVKNNKGGAIMLDGLEYLMVENGFDKTFKFVKRVNDLSSVNGSTFIVPINPGALSPDELTMLRKEFDRVEELSSPPPPPPGRKKR